MWRSRTEDAVSLVEVIPSRWDDEPMERARSFLAGVTGVGALSLEFAATSNGVRFYLRAPSSVVAHGLEAGLGAAYPQAGLRAVTANAHPDPNWCAPNEDTIGVALHLVGDPGLPLKSDWRHQLDPLSAILGAASALDHGERIVSQLVIGQAPERWAEGLRSTLARSEPRDDHRYPAASGVEVVPLAALLGLGAFGLQGYLWVRSGDLVPLLATTVAAVVGLPLAALLVTRLKGRRRDLPAKLVEEKLAEPAFAAELRLLAFGPPGSSRQRLRGQLEQVAAAYRAYDHSSGSGLRPRTRRGDAVRQAVRHGLFRRPDVLNAAEIAALWHPMADGPRGERMSARHFLPSSSELRRGCPVGVSAHQGTITPVHMPHPLLFRNQLIVAKTRRGKSTLLLHLAAYLMERMTTRGERASLVVVDPHQDLAEAVLGSVPESLEDRVVYLNLADRQRPVGLNLLDVALFPDRDRTAENVVTMLHRLWPDNWGPRMEGALRAAVSSLHEANSVRRRDDQYTLLDVLPMLTSSDFREEVLKQVPDASLLSWWRENYAQLNRVLQQQTANPVTTKIGRFIVTEAARLVIGQGRSTFDPRMLLREGGVLVVNSAAGMLGEGAASLMGASLLNLLGLVVEEQVTLPPAERSRLVALVDESSTLGAADYGHMLSELGKYGASFVLVTQSLAKLDAIDRALRPTIFANIDGLTVFQTSAEDADYLVDELGNGLVVEDLTDLDDFACYARWWTDGHKLPAFSLRLSPPPALQPERLQALARISAERYGRPRAEVSAEIDQRLSQRGGISGLPAGAEQESSEAESNPAGLQPTAKINPSSQSRSQHRDQRMRS